MRDLSVSVVVYNEDPEVLRETLGSVLGSDLALHLSVIDNSPTDALRGIMPSDPRLAYTHLPENPGFGAAHNRALREALKESRYHLVLNPDVTFDPGVLQRLVSFMDGNPGAGLVSPKVVYPDGRLQRLCKLLPTPADVFLRRILPDSTWVEKRNVRYELQDLAYDRVANIPYLSGCFMLLRTRVLAQVGLFDERFFMYFEDTDLSRRFHEVSETLLVPEVQITHRYGKGSYKSWGLLKVHILSAIRYFSKWGWVFDGRRKAVNAATLLRLRQSAPTSNNAFQD